MSVCVVVADSSKARILVAQGGHDPLTEHQDFVHPESRLKEQDLVSDGTGSGIDSGGYGKHSMGHEKSAHRQQVKLFANELCDAVDKLRRKIDVRRIYLVAPPTFLGLLRSGMGKPCVEMLAGEVDKNLVTLSLQQIRAHLPKRL